MTNVHSLFYFVFITMGVVQKKFGTYPNRFWSMSQKQRSHSNVDTDLVEKLASKAQGAAGMHGR